jgi:hypothetical protein
MENARVRSEEPTSIWSVAVPLGMHARGCQMSDPGHRHVERHNSAFWGIVVVFAVAMLGLIAYGYHGVRGLQASSSGAPDSTSGQSTREVPSQIPTATPQP